MLPDLTPAVQIAALTLFGIKVWELYLDAYVFKKTLCQSRMLSKVINGHSGS